MSQAQAGHLSVAPVPEALAADPAAPTATGQPVTLPPERRPSWTTLAFLAALAGAAALALGVWALIATDDNTRSRASARSIALERAVAVLADPAVERIPFSGSVGRIVLLVSERGDAVLMLKGLAPSQPHRRYQAWITVPGSGEILPAGAFDGSEPFVPLNKPVTSGVRVSVTVEDENGASLPSRIPRLSAVRA